METSIHIGYLFIILITHWVGDFILQTDWQAKNKSKNNQALTIHVVTYCSLWAIVISFILSPLNVLAFLVMTFACHWGTDYVTSRINTKLWSQGKVHWFFVSIGFDQFLHYVQLIITFNCLIQ